MNNGMIGLVDVSAADVDAARDFYTGLFGWTWRLDLDPGGSYVYADVDGLPVAGVRPRKPDEPSAWTVYLSTEDTRLAAEAAASRGGKVLHGPVVAQGQGVLAVVADPAGAVFGLWQQIGDWTVGHHRPGMVNWAELSTPEASVVDGFYVEAFGFSGTQIGDGDRYDYVIWSAGGAPGAGRLVAPPPAHWLPYFESGPGDVDRLADRAVATGGRVERPPADIPAGRVAVLSDPEGAKFAVIDPSRRP
ncbi:hypothetical protein GCM10011609_06700 [Lentzea pudingi]|uniref:VOC domain-containing protein n=1 Tax=Lentzea pudingi TaxID=1789439 RepID=A0ABQ2HCG1_9PSEU|nr:VOC family protein [Lentzea pudingi]GGM73556.1 hypothetical protein GCM10011609_06700 [Lentzea pudingi]